MDGLDEVDRERKELVVGSGWVDGGAAGRRAVRVERWEHGRVELLFDIGIKACLRNDSNGCVGYGSGVGGAVIVDVNGGLGGFAGGAS
jgi:hypothetical protein